MENFIYNPINDKKPSGACAVGQEITYTLKVSKFLQHNNCFFVLHKENEAEEKIHMQKVFADERYFYYEYKNTFLESGFYWYHFEVETNSGNINLIRSENFNVCPSDTNNDYLQLVITKESNIDPSLKKGIIYHILVDRFNRSGEVKARKGLKLINDWKYPIELEYNEKGERVNINCYGGNFQGIIDKLSYLKELNVSIIYLSPIFESNSSHKYDVADYSKIDSMFGNLEIFKELIDKAKKLGIKIIIDGVFNHTGSDSIYFNKEGRYRTVGAYQNKNSKYYDWYDFSDYPNEYSCWWGVKCLPQTNENSGFFDYITGRGCIIQKYMSMGIAGFRLDVVDELTNNFLRAICKSARAINPKALMVGEVWEDASTKISYDERKEYFLGGNLDSVTNYPIKNAILDFVKYGNVEEFVSAINMIKDQYPKSVQNNLMNIIDTHDTMRAITFLGTDDNSNVENNKDYVLNEKERANAINLVKMATIMQYTVMGIPTIFYGDEVGIEGTKDPFCRKPYPWDNPDLVILDWYKKLGELRNNKVLIDGDLNIKYAKNNVLIYERVKKDNKVVVIVNRSDKDFEFILDKTMCNYFTNDYISGKQIIEPNQGLILVL